MVTLLIVLAVLAALVIGYLILRRIAVRRGPGQHRFGPIRIRVGQDVSGGPGRPNPNSYAINADANRTWQNGNSGFLP